MKILGKVEYVGTAYNGWQKQKNGKTIQNVIESILSKIFNTEITIYGSGRTDTGVHASGQRFHFEIAKEKIDLGLLKHAINTILPDDIRIISLVKVDSNFDARKSAKKKIYEYAIIFGEAKVFQKPYFCEVKRQISRENFEKTLNLFVGKHNFSSFTSKVDDENNFVRTIYSIEIKNDGNQAIVTLIGDGFMKYMIRYLIGVALAVANGKMTLEEVKKRLEFSSSRQVTSFKAPANGLTLVDVLYDL